MRTGTFTSCSDHPGLTDSEDQIKKKINKGFTCYLKVRRKWDVHIS